jgi:hypothetical protein
MEDRPMLSATNRNLPASVPDSRRGMAAGFELLSWLPDIVTAEDFPLPIHLVFFILTIQRDGVAGSFRPIVSFASIAGSPSYLISVHPSSGWKCGGFLGS